MSRIRIQNLGKVYGQQAALAGIDLNIADGALLALLGPSGCGKSTTLQLLAGFEEPTTGEIWADEQLLSSPRSVVSPERRGVSLVFQNYAVWTHKSVAENVAFALNLQKLGTDEFKKRLDEALGTVQLTALRDRYPAELSGGQQQRVALARALAVRPRILLLDEPLSNLDANLREEMRFEIRRVHDMLGITTVLVTHDQADALSTADQVAVMNRGRIEQVGSPQDLFARPANAFVAKFIGSNNELRGVHLGGGCVRVEGRELRGHLDHALDVGAPASLCIRPSRITFGATVSADEANRVQGRVVRASYLGEYSDVLVDVGAQQTMRVNVDPRITVAVGEEVTLHFPIEQCQVLPVGANA
jgi:iron(III) transport system ATP-binding protein